MVYLKKVKENKMEEYHPDAFVDHIRKDKLVDLLLEENWQKECVIIPEYMPPYPREDTIPTVVVMYPNEHSNVFLRYSKGPAQGFSWDIYGDDMQTPELAILALSKAPVPLNYRKAEYPVTFEIPIGEKK